MSSDLDKGKTLVILQADIENRMIMVNQVVFQQQGVCFVFRDDEFQVVRFFQEVVDNEVVPAGEILRHPFVEVACFADVEDFITGLEKIDPRFPGDILIVYHY